jgi:outer membrane immunogenic protein
MRTSIFAFLSLLLGTAVGIAAELPRKILPPLASLERFASWSGPYLGGNFGGGITTATSDFSAVGLPIGTIDNSQSGAVGGAQAGYNWQNGPAVFGVEADIQFSGMAGSVSAQCPTPMCLSPVTASFAQTMPWFGTVRARLGYAADSWLVYATGGYAYASVKTDASVTAPGFSALLGQSEMRNGWTAGGGIELAFSRHWSARLEYLYLDFGRADTAWTLDGLSAIGDSAKIVSSVVRAGVNYRF